MFPFVNSPMFSMLVAQKLDAIVAGQAPEGFKIVERTPQSVTLAPEESPEIKGVEIKSVRVECLYKGVTIKLLHG